MVLEMRLLVVIYWRGVSGKGASTREDAVMGKIASMVLK